LDKVKGPKEKKSKKSSGASDPKRALSRRVKVALHLTALGEVSLSFTHFVFCFWAVGTSEDSIVLLNRGK
jgi:hypothetical protein